MASSISESRHSRWALRERTLRLSALSGRDSSSVTRDWCAGRTNQKWHHQNVARGENPSISSGSIHWMIIISINQAWAERNGNALSFRELRVSCLSFSGIKVWPAGAAGSGAFLLFSSRSLLHCFFLSSRLRVKIIAMSNSRQYTDTSQWLPAADWKPEMRKCTEHHQINLLVLLLLQV